MLRDLHAWCRFLRALRACVCSTWFGRGRRKRGERPRLRPAFETLERRELLTTAQFTQPVVALPEAAGNATFTVSLSAPALQPVQVSYGPGAPGSATPGEDYVPVSGVLTFLPGQQTASFVVPVIDDPLSLPDVEVEFYHSRGVIHTPTY